MISITMADMEDPDRMDHTRKLISPRSGRPITHRAAVAELHEYSAQEMRDMCTTIAFFHLLAEATDTSKVHRQFPTRITLPTNFAFEGKRIDLESIAKKLVTDDV